MYEEEAKGGSPLGAGAEANEDEDRKLAMRLQGQEQARAAVRRALPEVPSYSPSF